MGKDAKRIPFDKKYIGKTQREGFSDAKIELNGRTIQLYFQLVCVADLALFSPWFCQFFRVKLGNGFYSRVC